MVAPVIRRFTRATPASLDQFAFATDDITGLTFYLATKRNQILDIVNDPDPPAGARYEIALYKNGVDTGRRFFSTSLSPASAGRIAIGPIDIEPGQIQFNVAQRAGTLSSYSFIVKFLTI